MNPSHQPASGRLRTNSNVLPVSSETPMIVRLWTFLGECLGDLSYMAKTRAPFGLYAGYFKTILNRGAARAHLAAERDYRAAMERDGEFSSKWFWNRIPYWLMVFEDNGLLDRPARVLEIGSWEGMSSVFFLMALPKAELTCVDTWMGGDEHQGRPGLNLIEDRFDQNTKAYRDRLTKYKGTSFKFFSDCSGTNQFDVVYVDGSHHCDDVIVDLVKGFEQLKPGGVLIIDDYFWRHYKRPEDNPAAAINAFLKLKTGRFEMVAVFRQVVIRKTDEG